jgi:hypothetical protein
MMGVWAEQQVYMCLADNLPKVMKVSEFNLLIQYIKPIYNVHLKQSTILHQPTPIPLVLAE